MPLVISALGVSDAAAALIARGPSVVRAVHRQGASIGVVGQQDIVYLGMPGHGLLPLHVIVDRFGLASVLERAAEARAQRSDALQVCFNLVRARRFAVRLTPLCGMRSARAQIAVEAVGEWLRSQPTPSGLGESMASVLAPGSRWRRALAGYAGGTIDELRSLIGRGSGATPAGDDLLVGALAHSWASEGGTSTLIARLGALAGEFDRLTTVTSGTYLRAALRGEFGSHLAAFAYALSRGDPDRLFATARRVARHGSTSGIDTLSGFVLAADKHSSDA